MKRKFGIFSIVLLSMLLGLGMLACSSNGGNGDDGGTCTDPALPWLCPQDNACHECCQPEDCLADETCGADFLCEKLCTGSGEDCSRDRGSCCDDPPLGCDAFSNVCTACCTADDCPTTHSTIPFADDLVCDDCVCDFVHCTNDGQCPPGLVCFDHDCVTKPDCSDLADNCSISPSSAVTQDGTTASFAATALMASGALAPGMVFEWESSDDAIASVSAGLVTGGATTGNATITATVSGCSSTCTATVVNYGAVTPGDTRVVVVDELEGTPIMGASVEVAGQAAQITNDQGAVTLAGVDLSAAAADINIFKEDYIYMTLRQVGTNDVIAHVLKLHSYNFNEDPPEAQAGGVRGAFDFGQIPCQENKTCDVLIGFAGMSIPGNLVNLNIDLLIGGMINVNIETLGFETPLPAGVVACVGGQCFVEHYKPTGVPGIRTAWGLGAKVDLNEIVAIAGPLISGGGDIQIGPLLASIMPLLETAYTSVVPNVEVTPIPKILDVNDIDVNPNTTHVPDYDNFPTLNMSPKVPMDQSLTINVPDFPARADGWHYDGVLLLAGVLVKGAGMVPLGINAGLDTVDENESPDGMVDSPIVMKVSDVAGRIPEDQVQRLVLALALHLGDLTAAEPQPFVMSGQVIYLGDSFDTTVTLDPFMTPATFIYDPVARTLSVDDIPANADYCHAIFSTGDGSTFWHVLGEWAAGDYALPAAPATGDRAETATFIGIDLIDGLDFPDLPKFNSTNMGDMAELVQNFVVVSEAGAGIGGMDCEDCSTPGAAGGGVALSLVLVLGLALFRRRRK